MKEEDLKQRFEYHHASATQSTNYDEIALLYFNFSKIINEMCPSSREKSLAITRIEESMMWLFAGISRHEEHITLNEGRSIINA